MDHGHDDRYGNVGPLAATSIVISTDHNALKSILDMTAATGILNRGCLRILKLVPITTGSSGSRKHKNLNENVGPFTMASL